MQDGFFAALAKHSLGSRLGPIDPNAASYLASGGTADASSGEPTIALTPQEAELVLPRPGGSYGRP